MARGKRKGKLEELAGQTDPRAPLDGAAFLAAAQPVMKGLTEDLAARAKGSAAVTEALRKRWSAEKQAQRTADGFGAWQERLCEQVAAAWLLSCVFVRTLEDRGLLGRVRIAGQGAADGQRVFFELAPSLTERDYLLMVFRELSRLGAAAGLFDARHNPVWMLAPSAEGAKRLLGLFRTPSVEEPAFRFGQEDTRFLGDLYQDLDEGVRKRFALLQTPRFVEAFILDRTLDVALEKHGVDDVEVIDPTCGSGHFLLGSFERLFERRLRAEPGIEVREAAAKALGGVYGADLNPYAVAIARFRLVLAFVEKGGWRRIAEVPRVDVNVVVADSLLHGSAGGQVGFSEMEGQSAEVWRGEEFALEDEEVAKKVLGRRYAAVVGNPPYITVKDKVLRERYREMYPRSATGKYSVAAPFTERFFQLARAGGRVGMITANSFMKREFGTKLIEEYLPSVNLDAVVNTSGAYIPGHGTPTVLLFGSNEESQGDEVLTVLASRGEPSTPEDPEKGLVWSSIAEHWAEVGFENDYISVMRTERGALGKHPWSLAGGGATELKELLEKRAEWTLDAIAGSIGIASFTLEDDVFLRPSSTWTRQGIERGRTRPMAIGEVIRDWSIAEEETPISFWPYDDDFGVIADDAAELRVMWPWRTNLSNNMLFGGKTKIQGGLKWHEYGRLTADKLRSPLTIAFAFVATHNHFVLDRGGKVFNRSAPIIKLPETATEDEHLALLAYLNSSTACFWMKQVCFEKSSQNYVGDVRDRPERIHFEFAGTPLKQLPLPPGFHALSTLGRSCDDLAARRNALAPSEVVRRWQKEGQRQDLVQVLRRAEDQERKIRNLLVCLQEEVDWAVYRLFGLVDVILSKSTDHCPILPEDRPGIAIASIVPSSLSDQYGLIWRERRAASKRKPLSNIEQPLYKRPWLGVQGVFHRDERTYADQSLVAFEGAFLSGIEALLAEGTRTVRDLLSAADTSSAIQPILDASRSLGLQLNPPTLIEREAMPFLCALTYTETGIQRRQAWEETWEAQRREDRGEAVGPIAVPPKYSEKDFTSPTYYRIRGKLDVPKERFISYPHCESKESPSPLYGWAGWNHEQRARALATLYWSRKTEEGWLVPKPDDPPNTPDLTPMLAGLLELLPWLHQWHAAPSDDYGGDSPASYFSAFLEGQCQELGLTHDDLRAWRPPKTRGRTSAPKAPKPPKAKASKRTSKLEPEATASDVTSDASTPGDPPRKPRRTKAKAANPDPDPAFTLSPAPTDAEDNWKSTKKKSKNSATPTPAPSRRRKPSEPA